jgi:hypothetical protein
MRLIRQTCLRLPHDNLHVETRPATAGVSGSATTCTLLTVILRSPPWRATRDLSHCLNNWPVATLTPTATAPVGIQFPHPLPLRGIKTPMACKHVKEIKNVTPSANGCEDCLKIGGQWVHLRLCLSCGHVGCCDSSPNHHATKHFHGTKHAIIKSFEPGEDWRWCYVDQIEV